MSKDSVTCRSLCEERGKSLRSAFRSWNYSTQKDNANLESEVST